MSPAELAACAPHVSPITLAAVIRVESHGNPLALHVNKGPQPPPAETTAQAIAYATTAIAHGYSVDLGLMQVNSQNLGALGYSMADTFSPCRNISAGARILTADYVAAAKRIGPGQYALLAALSAYNSGSFTKGFYTGYVGQYFRIPSAHIAMSARRWRADHYYIDPNYAPIRVYSRQDRP